MHFSVRTTSLSRCGIEFDPRTAAEVAEAIDDRGADTEPATRCEHIYVEATSPQGAQGRRPWRRPRLQLLLCEAIGINSAGARRARASPPPRHHPGRARPPQRRRRARPCLAAFGAADPRPRRDRRPRAAACFARSRSRLAGRPQNPRRRRRGPCSPRGRATLSTDRTGGWFHVSRAATAVPSQAHRTAAPGRPRLPRLLPMPEGGGVVGRSAVLAARCRSPRIASDIEDAAQRAGVRRLRGERRPGSAPKRRGRAPRRRADPLVTIADPRASRATSVSTMG